jgi:hypothetical protein
MDSPNIQVLDGINPSTALPPTTAQSKRLAPPLPRQRVIILFHDHLYPYRPRRSAIIDRAPSPWFPSYSSTWSNESIDASGQFEQVQVWWKKYLGGYRCRFARIGYSFGRSRYSELIIAF